MLKQNGSIGISMNPLVQIVFSATDFSRENVGEEQVKFRFSCHQRRKCSYLFQREYRFLLEYSSEKFLKK